MSKVTKIFIISLFAFLFAIGTQAQVRIAIIDTDYILNKIPDYLSSQTSLENLAMEWQQEIEEKFAEIEKLYKAYQSEAVMLPEDVKLKRQNEIIQKEKEVKDIQKQRFGTDGDLSKKREEMLKPIQDRVYTAIEEYANEGNYNLVLDRANSSQIMYVSPKMDKSDEILEKIGY
jgi:outer membrane protein